MRRSVPPRRVAAALLLGVFAPAGVADASWQVPAPRLARYTHFTNLADGATIETPFLLKFGLVGMGLAPITQAQPNTGHHHLLINRELPLDFGKPLPFSDQYVHFGKGQMETVLTLKPGQYTLRLVLADNRHVPDFVYSKPLHVTVTKFHPEVAPDALSRPGVEILLPKTAARVREPFEVEFHASKANVSHIALRQPGTGHFRLRVTSERGESQLLDMTGGETETWLAPPHGRYTLALDFVDNVEPGRVLYSAKPAQFEVD